MSNKMMKAVAHLLSNPAGIQNDMRESMLMAQNHLSEKYLTKMTKAVAQCQKKAMENPSPQIDLLLAVKPFIPEESHPRVNQMIEMLQFYQTMDEIRTSIQEELPPADTRPLSAASVGSFTPDPSVHEDGVYDVDSNCTLPARANQATMQNSNPMGMLLALSLMNR